MAQIIDGLDTMLLDRLLRSLTAWSRCCCTGGSDNRRHDHGVVEQVAQIIDVDTVPERCRRVRLLKHGSDRPLGFYIRDGTSLRVTPTGLEKVR